MIIERNGNREPSKSQVRRRRRLETLVKHVKNAEPAGLAPRLPGSGRRRGGIVVRY